MDSKSLAPAVLRLFYNSMKPGVASNLSNKDFTNKELDVLRQAIYNKRYELDRYGSETLNQMLNTRFNQMGYGDRDRTALVDNAIGQWNYPTSDTSMRNSLGRFFYNIDKDGNAIISDKYDVNGNEKYTDPLRMSGLFLLNKRNNPYNINLNLGNPKNWNMKYTGNELLHIKPEY